MRICFKHAQVWKDGSLRPADVLVSDGRIVSIGDRVSCSTDTVWIEVHNAVIFPGFVDVHVHLREPGFSYKETIRTGTLAAAHGGFAHVAAMPNLNPVPDCKASLEEELRRIRESACVHVHPYGAISVGQKGEQLADLDAMVPEVIAFSDDGKGVQSESLMRDYIFFRGSNVIFRCVCNVTKITYERGFFRFHVYKTRYRDDLFIHASPFSFQCVPVEHETA